ncbi:MFS transporter [Stappia sp.]|uniref:MFS transporter n=1 Tax=Stappia sp. TaxID=1870903 RepID=UPI003A99B5B3
MKASVRAVALLGLTQILGYGTLFYAVVLTAPRIAETFGWSKATGLGGFSLGLLVAGLASPRVGGLIEVHGGRKVMVIGSLVAATGLAAMSLVNGLASYFAVWALLGLAMSMTLYDSAFATLGSLFGAAARTRITALTLIAGFASTLAWPATLWLVENHGWRTTYLVFAGAMLLLAVPAHLLLPRAGGVAASRDAGHGGPDGADVAPPRVEPSARTRRRIFALLALSFSCNAFLFIGLSAHLLAALIALGLPAATAVAVGTLIGPSQVGARVVELVFARRTHPLGVALVSAGLIPLAFAVLVFAGVEPVPAAVFAVVYGGSNGLVTIVRGTLPLALFGAQGYARLLGRIARPVLIVGAAAPFAIGAVIDAGGPAAGLALAFVAGCLSFSALAGIALVLRAERRSETASTG